MQPKYKRVLLKLSGEALLGNERTGDPFNPKIIEQYDQIGITIIGTDPQGQAKFLANDIARWRDVIKNAKIPQQ